MTREPEFSLTVLSPPLPKQRVPKKRSRLSFWLRLAVSWGLLLLTYGVLDSLSFY